MRLKYSVFSIIVIMFGVLISSCGGGDQATPDRLDTLESESGTVTIAPSEVTFDVSMIEIKGATDGIDAPEVDPKSLSAGYRFAAPGEYDPDNPNKWQVSTYMFSPASMTAAQGDKVTLRAFVINGDHHTVWLEAPDGSTVASTEEMNRGREYKVTFTAEQSGYYTLHCNEHAPTMSAQILVLPTG